MRSRRELFTWVLPAPEQREAEAPPRKPAPTAVPRSDRAPGIPPEIPPEIAARAARFRAEREARATAALPTGRISWLDAADTPAPAAPAGVGVGLVAVLRADACLNAGADFCATCVERCPAPGALRLDGRRIVVEASRCTGCGICVIACPAPGGALSLLPLAPAP